MIHRRGKREGFHCGHRQRGMALIMVLLSMALVVMMAAGMVQQQSVRVFRAGHILAQTQGYNIALGAEAMVKQALFEDLKEDQENNQFVDSPNEVYWSKSLVYPIETLGVVEIQADDLSGRINLNNLVTPAGAINPVTRDRLSRLLMVLGITDVHVDAFVDWIDQNEEPMSAYGSEDGQYLMKQPPYRAANDYFTSVTELRLIEGMTEEIYQALVPHVAVLPVSGTAINVNMAKKPVIRSLDQRITDDQADQVIARREKEHFATVRDFTALQQFAGLELQSEGLKVSTDFFDAVIRITYDNRVVSLVSTMHRTQNGEFSVVRRDSGQKYRITKEPAGVSEE